MFAGILHIRGGINCLLDSQTPHCRVHSMSACPYIHLSSTLSSVSTFQRPPIARALSSGGLSSGGGCAPSDKSQSPEVNMW